MATYEVEIHYLLVAEVEADSPEEAFDLVNEDEVLKGEMVVNDWHAYEIES